MCATLCTQWSCSDIVVEVVNEWVVFSPSSVYMQPVKMTSVPPWQETGVGKTVNSLRKNDLVGEFAKGLVAKWKKLVPQPADR